MIPGLLLLYVARFHPVMGLSFDHLTLFVVAPNHQKETTWTDIPIESHSHALQPVPASHTRIYVLTTTAVNGRATYRSPTTKTPLARPRNRLTPLHVRGHNRFRALGLQLISGDVIGNSTPTAGGLLIKYAWSSNTFVSIINWK